MDLFYWGGPVTPKQAREITWQTPTKVLTRGANGSSANFQIYKQFEAPLGYAWPTMAETAGIDPTQLGSLGIGGFSAFHGFANAFLKNPQDRARVSYVHLADACFQGGTATEPKQGFLEYAREAVNPESGKLLVATTNGPYGQTIRYWGPSPSTGQRTEYFLTSGALCLQHVWDAVGGTEWTPVVPPGVAPPTFAKAKGNFLWFHYEDPPGQDPHGYHVLKIATPYMSFYGAPWMAARTYPGEEKAHGGLSGPMVALLTGAAALGAYSLWKWKFAPKQRYTRSTPNPYPWLTLREVERWEPLAAELGVSQVARSPRGFLTAYRRSGVPGSLSETWVQKREAFVARHLAQVQQRGEPLFQDGLPTRRHLALIMWAYSPAKSRLTRTP